jgi:hypothetical protein
LTLAAGRSLTVSSLPNDTTTGFQWRTGAIAQSTASDILIISGGGTADNNFWSGGTINATTTQSNIYINGYSTLRITASAATLGDNIIIGQDGDGACTLEFLNQSSTLQVNNNAYIKVADTTSDFGANRLLFDTDVTAGGTASKGLATTSADSFIDNYGTVTRSNPGTLQIDLPIKNETSSYYGAVLDLQSGLWISGRSANKTANTSLDQEGGKTVLENGIAFMVRSILINAGQLLTYGSSQATINQETGSWGTLLTVSGGTIQASADNTALYGSLAVNGNMTWNGGTFQTYVNGATSGQQTQLVIGGGGTLTMTTGAHLAANVNGNIQANLTWNPVVGSMSGTLTFDTGTLFNISYGNNPSQINLTPIPLPPP